MRISSLISRKFFHDLKIALDKRKVKIHVPSLNVLYLSVPTFRKILVEKVIAFSTPCPSEKHARRDKKKLWSSGKQPVPTAAPPNSPKLIDKLLGSKQCTSSKIWLNEPTRVLSRYHKMEKQKATSVKKIEKMHQHQRFSYNLKNTSRSLSEVLLPNMMFSGVVYQITCSLCKRSYVGRSTNHFATQTHEHSWPAFHFDEHLFGCGSMNEAENQIIEKGNSVSKLTTLEALQIGRKAARLKQKFFYLSHGNSP